ncbi:MAG: hypothetical protein M2R45_00496 [Verrucomicrobia subdivision 3 bacterium]|nr:hypothetical protein [Limisphaerales bacterium]MCS1413626.1 hypothetical protein [Limisphaerales bacterium]
MNGEIHHVLEGITRIAAEYWLIITGVTALLSLFFSIGY